MSIHQSLAVKGKLVRQRNVFTRVERINQLIKEGKLQEEDSPAGLPKVRTKFKMKGKKKKEAREEKEAEEKADE